MMEGMNSVGIHPSTQHVIPDYETSFVLRLFSCQEVLYQVQARLER